MGEAKEFATSDLALSAYLKMKGIELLRVDRSDPNRAVFYFDDMAETIEGLVFEFVNSDFRKYDAEIRALKKLIHR